MAFLQNVSYPDMSTEQRVSHCTSTHTFYTPEEYKYTLIIGTLIHGPICISVYTFRPLKSGHLPSKDTLIIETLVHGEKQFQANYTEYI